MLARKAINSEPIPGYRLIEPLGTGGFGEVWKCEAPGGLFKAIKFVYGRSQHLDADPIGVEQEFRALQHIKTIRHPFLLSIDRVEVADGDLVIVSELADGSLGDLLREHQRAGRAGLPRAELLRYLREVAEILDLLGQEHGLQHLDVKPTNLFFLGGHAKLGDFGLVNSLTELSEGEAQLPQAAVSPLYSAPELFQGKMTVFSDQYSLAVSCYELLTGQLPFIGKNPRQLALLHAQAEPNLECLASDDQAILAQALAKEPRHRFPSCTDLLRALEIATPMTEGFSSRETACEVHLGDKTTTVIDRGAFTRVLRTRSLAAVGANGNTESTEGEHPSHQMELLPEAEIETVIATLKTDLDELIAAAARDVQVQDALRCRTRTGLGIETKYFTRLVPGTAWEKLDSFRQQWDAEASTGDTSTFLFTIRTPTRFLGRFLGSRPSLEVKVRLLPPQSAVAALTPVVATIRPIQCSPQQGEPLLRELGPSLLESLRSYLQASDERTNQRYPFTQPVRVSPRVEGVQVGEPVGAQGKDISRGGIGLYLPGRPPALDLYIHLPRPTPRLPILVPARVLHTQPCGDGRYVIGVRFLSDEKRS
jgi:serine/threonine protein kinase